jgi:N-acetylneuraminic acid mutarotase
MLSGRSSRIERSLTTILLLLLITCLLTVAPGSAPAMPVLAQSFTPACMEPEELLGPYEERGPELTSASHAADASTEVWQALPNTGLDRRVRAMELMGSDLYVGGLFTQTSDGQITDLGHIVRYDIEANTWNALPNQGLSHEVKALAAVGSDLYVGGIFTQTADGDVLNLGHIARYDTVAGTWHPLSSGGLDDSVAALVAVGNDLYVGGRFNQTADGSLTDLGYVARYDTVAGTWYALPNDGLWGHVYAMAAGGSAVYFGGGFTQTWDGTVVLGHMARFDTIAPAWHTLPNSGLNGDVTGLTVSGDVLYAGGNFTQTADAAISLGHIAHFDTTGASWSTLPNQGLDDYVSAIAVMGNDVYAGGQFGQTGDGTLTDLGHIARYDSAANTWNALPSQGLSNWVYALTIAGDDLYVGGNFSTTGDQSPPSVSRIARYGERKYVVYLPLVIR